MSKHNRKNIEFSSFGFSTILLTFVMICIVTISAVSLLTANSDYNLSKKVEEKNTAYYEAEVIAYNTLAKIDAILAEAYQKSSSESAYFAYAKQALSDYGTYDDQTSTKQYISYEIMISDGHTLQIKLELNYPDHSNDRFYHIKKWQSVYETTLHEDETLNLMQ